MSKRRYEPPGTLPRVGDWVQDPVERLPGLVFSPYYVVGVKRGAVEVEGVSGAGRVTRWHYLPEQKLLVYKRAALRRGAKERGKS